MEPVKVYIVSLGCAKNLVDTELMMGRMRRAEMDFVADPGKADVILVNTCGFLQDAKEESIDTILEMAGQEPKVLAVTGCMIERYRDEIRREIPEIDVLLGVADEERIVSAIFDSLRRNNGDLARERAEPPGPVVHPNGYGRVLATPPHTAYLRIAEGCDLECSFCVIPQIRGPQKSRTEKEILEEARWLAEAGTVELSVIAQDITRYGTDLEGGGRLPGLLRSLAETDGIRWIRLHYANPLGVTKELADVIAEEEKICPYLDMPIQHVNDRILKSMRRGETKGTIREKINLLRSKVPAIALRTSVIIGYPGEGEDEFQELVDFLLEVKIDHVGVFTFSAEEGTPAAELPGQVDESEKNRRLLTVLHHLDKLKEKKMAESLDSETEVIIDRPSDVFVDFMQGRIPGQGIEVDGVTYVRGNGLKTGEIVPATIIDFKDQDYFAERKEAPGE
jgi:ribosomal protein S12 methylthiotransferase